MQFFDAHSRRERIRWRDYSIQPFIRYFKENNSPDADDHTSWMRFLTNLGLLSKYGRCRHDYDLTCRVLALDHGPLTYTHREQLRSEASTVW